MGDLAILNVLAGLAVRDQEAAEAWMERLIGRPADARPMDGLIELDYDDSTSTKVRFGQVSDPDGNAITIVEARAGFDPAASG